MNLHKTTKQYHCEFVQSERRRENLYRAYRYDINEFRLDDDE